MIYAIIGFSIYGHLKMSGLTFSFYVTFLNNL
jgi:hypothetical protein